MFRRTLKSMYWKFTFPSILSSLLFLFPGMEQRMSRLSSTRLRNFVLLLLSVALALATSEALKMIIKTLNAKRGPQISPVTLQPGLKIKDYEGPVIGVLGQKIKRSKSLLTYNAKTLSAKFSKYGNNYLPASYVRFVETAGNHDNICSHFFNL